MCITGNWLSVRMSKVMNSRRMSCISEGTLQKAHDQEFDQAETDVNPHDTNPLTTLTIPQVLVLTSSILIMIVVLQIPTVLYYTDQPSELTALPSFGIDFESCSPDGAPATFPIVSITEYCPDVTPLVIQNNSMCGLYSAGSLALLQSINAFSSVLENEQCNNSALPFICNITHLLCEDLEVDLEGECVEIRDYDCAVVWRTLQNVFNVPLPDCASFVVGGNLTFSRAPPLTCHDQFDLYCNSFCLPSCERYSQIPWNDVFISNIVTIVLISISLLGGVLTLIVSVLNRKMMFQFPQIFIVYNTLIVMFLFLLIAPPLIFGHSIFYCSDSNALEAFNNPTGFCQAQGYVLHAGILCFGGFFLCHMAHVFFSLAFPFKTKKLLSKYSKIVHIAEVIVVLVSGNLPGVIVLIVSKYQFDKFPPNVCNPSISVFFYTFTLPLEIYATICMALLFAIFALLHQNHQLNAARKSKNLTASSKPFCSGFLAPEAKSLVLFCCYFFMLLVLLAYTTINFQTFDSIVETLETYFRCSLAGDKPECDIYKEELEDNYQLPYYFAFVTYFMISALNLENLTYALHLHDIKSFIKKVCISQHR